MRIAGCPECGEELFRVLFDESQGEHVLQCVAHGHEVRRFFVLKPPDLPAHPERSAHAAAQVTRPDR
jgi:hypothetical protein